MHYRMHLGWKPSCSVRLWRPTSQVGDGPELIRENEGQEGGGVVLSKAESSNYSSREVCVQRN